MPYALLLAPTIIHILPPPQFPLISIPYHNTLIPKQTGLSSSPHSPENFNFWPLASFCCIPLFVWSPTEPKEVLILSQPKGLHQTTFCSLIMHLSSTIFSPTILPVTHSTSSLHQHWPVLIWFPFCSFLSLLTWLLNLSIYPFTSAPSILPILTSALTLSLTSVQHLTSQPPQASVSIQAEDHLATDQPDVLVHVILLTHCTHCDFTRKTTFSPA